MPQWARSNVHGHADRDGRAAVEDAVSVEDGAAECRRWAPPFVKVSSNVVVPHDGGLDCPVQLHEHVEELVAVRADDPDRREDAHSFGLWGQREGALEVGSQEHVVVQSCADDDRVRDLWRRRRRLLRGKVDALLLEVAADDDAALCLIETAEDDLVFDSGHRRQRPCLHRGVSTESPVEDDAGKSSAKTARFVACMIAGVAGRLFPRRRSVTIFASTPRPSTMLSTRQSFAYACDMTSSSRARFSSIAVRRDMWISSGIGDDAAVAARAVAVVSRIRTCPLTMSNWRSALVPPSSRYVEVDVAAL